MMRKTPETPSDPISRAAWMGALPILGGILVLARNGPHAVMSALPTLGLGFFVLVGVARYRRQTRIARQMNAALDLVARGTLEDAEKALDALPRRLPRHLRRAVHLQRAMIALIREQPEAAVAEATRAIDGRIGRLSAVLEEPEILGARALRALATASLDRFDAAMADVAEVRRSPAAREDVLARAAVAEAVVLSRSGAHAELATFLTKNRRLLMELTTVRDRALVRALQRSVQAPRGGAYRTFAQRDAAPTTTTAMAGWIAEVAPSAAPFASRVPRAAAAVVPSSSASASDAPPRRAIPRAPQSKLSRQMQIAMLSVAFAAAAASGLSGGRFVDFDDPILVGGFVVAFVVGMLVFAVSVGRRSRRRASEAHRLLAVGDRAGAIQAFSAQASSGIGGAAAAAHLELARLAAMKGSFEEALDACDRGLARLARDRAVLPLVSARLTAERAYVLAALGRERESAAELRALDTEPGAAPILTASALRVRMMSAIRRGDVTAARALSAARSVDLPLDYRDELLADALLATGDPECPTEEIERLRAELADDAELRVWLATVWPGAEAALNAAAASRHVA